MKNMIKLLSAFLLLTTVNARLNAVEVPVASSAAVIVAGCPVCSARPAQWYMLSSEQATQQLARQEASQAIADRSFTKKCIKVALTAGVITVVAVVGVKHCISYIPTSFEFSAKKPFG